MKYALIDMGSNSIRLSVYEIKMDSFQILFKKKVMAGLAGYVEKGTLTQDGIDCAISSLNTLIDILDSLEIKNFSVFATASLRNISNTDEALQKIYQATGIHVDILTGEQEAKCGFQGALYDAKINKGLFCDIGGASAELVSFSKEEVRAACSVPVGSLRLHRDCVKEILPGEKSVIRLQKTIEKNFEKSAIGDFKKSDKLICVGGTARATLKLIQKVYKSKSNNSFTKNQLNDLVKLLTTNRQQAVSILLRYTPERIHTMIPGLLVLQYIVQTYEVKEIIVSQYGAREGYLNKVVLPKIQNNLGVQ